MELWVISLEESAERRRDFAEANEHLEFKFFDAVNGKEVTSRWLKNPLKDKSLFDKSLRYTAGAVGCAMSHLQMWERCIAAGAPMTILEDDAITRFDFDKVQQEVVSNLPADWDFVLWGWNFDSVLVPGEMEGLSPVLMLFDQEAMRANVDAFQAMNQGPKLLKLKHAFGIPAYSISPKGAKLLKERCFPLRELQFSVPLTRISVPNNGVDIPMNMAYPHLQAFVAFPPLVITENIHEISTVQTTERD